MGGGGGEGRGQERERRIRDVGGHAAAADGGCESKVMRGGIAETGESRDGQLERGIAQVSRGRRVGFVRVVLVYPFPTSLLYA